MKLSAISISKGGKLSGTDSLMQLIILMLFVGFSSCEYQLKEEEFVEIKPPNAENDFNVNININMLAPGDTLFIFNPTTIDYNINAYGLDIQRATLNLPGESWPLKSSGQLTIDPKDFTPGIYTLTLLLITNSGTGSIGDITGNEGYGLKMEWVAVIDNRGGPYMEFIKTINEDGFLTLKWNPVTNLNFSHYELRRYYGYETYSRDIYNPQDTTFIDSCYFAGEVSYDIHTVVKTKWADMGYGSNLSIDEPVPQLHFQMHGLDSVDVSWNRTKYPANYTLHHPISNDLSLIVSGTDTSYTLLAPPLGSFNNYKFIISALYSSSDCQFSTTQFERYSQGKPLNARTRDYACNTVDGLVYTGYASLLKTFDVHTFDLVDSTWMIELSGEYSCPPNSTKLASLSRFKEILIFENKYLANPVSIPVNYASPDYFRLTTNNLVAVAKTNHFALLSTETQQQVARLDITDFPYYSVWACLGCSPQGKFAAVCTNNGIHIYDISQQSFEQVYQDTRNYRSLQFNDLNDNELFITLKDQPILEVRSSAGFNLIRTISLPKASVICNVDPYTGYMLLTDFTFAYILDLNSGQIKLTVRSVDRRPKLFNGWLLTESGSALNISTYLP